MTNEDVFIQILHEVTGLPKADLCQVCEGIRQRAADHKLDEELSPAKAEKLLEQLRSEKSGILNWVLAGIRFEDGDFA